MTGPVAQRGSLGQAGPVAQAGSLGQAGSVTQAGPLGQAGSLGQAGPVGPRPPERRDVVTVLCSGAAVLLAAAPVGVLVQGPAWFAHAGVLVGLLTLIGLLPARVPAPAVVVAQGVVWFAALAVLFTENTTLLPGPATSAIAELAAGARSQIEIGVVPLASTPEILLLTTGAIGLITILVQAVAVGATAPAAAAIPLLVLFAVPAALADELLPWWALASAALGLGVLLAARTRLHRRALAGAAALVAVGTAVGLLAGLALPVGTAGRLGPGGSAAGSATIGLSPFTSLRGALTQDTPVDLFAVSGLPRSTYLRALTLSEFDPEQGWRAGRPDAGVELPGPVPAPAAGEPVRVQVTNLGFADYWLPVYGTPTEVTDLPAATWRYDPTSGTGYASRPQQPPSWTQSAVLPTPELADLRSGEGAAADQVPARYLDLAGVDPRVTDLAAQVTTGAATDYDRALAVNEWFTGPDSEFRYDLATAPGGGDDALVEFLTVGRVGYCEQFASAMAVMLRTLDIPARVAVGFTGGTADGASRVISTDDAHAWVEAWFPGAGWTLFDPTPLADGRGIVPDHVLEAGGGQDPEQAEPEPLADEQVPTGTPALPSPEDPTDPGAAPASDPLGEDGRSWGWLLLLGPALALAAAPAGVRALYRRRRLATAAADGADAAAAAWSEVLAESADRGVDALVTDTVRSTGRRIAREHGLDGDAADALRQVMRAVEAQWYGDPQQYRAPQQYGAPPQHGDSRGPGDSRRSGPIAPVGALVAAVGRIRVGMDGGRPVGPIGRLCPRSVWAFTPGRTGGGTAPPSDR